jgi:hypothetical protein
MITTTITIERKPNGLVEVKASSPSGEAATIDEINIAKKLMGGVRELMDAEMEKTGEGIRIEKDTVECPHCHRPVSAPPLGARVNICHCPHCAKAFAQ